MLYLTMKLSCLQSSFQNQSKKLRYIVLVYEKEGKCVSNTLYGLSLAFFDFVTAAICALKLNVPTLLLVVDYIHLN